ncbi:hypothetical protein MFLO_00845 [Listeria floridensis FSL S10-1187]|uniref:Uncharacterized protein n=1 Tax=Listeria floridensis FSL S10-1187 TaxID=1265817 RepID=A0ABN0RIJ1_9LIST|nr:hypothetical protein [Listeria floridensis]EUJ33743.1 hypothetical protein MFLO_00845 [Listeria floridensis FSL S10-1187]
MGINLALLLDFLAQIEDYELNSQVAIKVRNKTKEVCINLRNEIDFDKRNDCYWICATLAEVYFSFDEEENFRKIMSEADAYSPTKFERSSTIEQLQIIKKLKEIDINID